MLPAEASRMIQDQHETESESDDARSNISTEDSEDERWHFELRVDPTEDVCDDNEENVTPGPSRKRARGQEDTPLSWKTERDGDTAPGHLRFVPAREPGVQLSTEDHHTPLSLFKLFFSNDAVKTLCRNTNKQAARKIGRGAKYRWVDVGVPEFYKFIGLIFYMGIIKMKQITDYWRKHSIFSVAFPGEMMSRDRYRTILWNLHMSDPDEDLVNDAMRRASKHDKLFRVKPLMTTIQDACTSFYHPRKDLSVRQYLKGKPNKWGFKLFVLTDSSNGYTANFNIYTGKNKFPKGHGLPYDSVMSLTNKSYLGSGYHIYMDDFHTSPKLFKDLYALKFPACGTYRESRSDCPRSDINALTKDSPRGTIRWIRDGPLLYVKWMDSQEVSVCSTIHAAHGGDTVQRRGKNRLGAWSSQAVPCPKPVVEYSKVMGGVDASDQLIQYYTAQHKTVKWYKKLFFHLLDIAASNAFILHKELMQEMHRKSMTHKEFLEELCAELCGVSLASSQPEKAPPKRTAPVSCMPVCGIDLYTNGSRVSDGRRCCVHCKMQGRQTKTQWKCDLCDVYLCVQQGRNCFVDWHRDDN
ncbi:piggyBac transposable element-derived protein 4-like [Sardina pilchardus]|uniref:piggyBac transposable element-derived protein 4-like n=1 Tax=Sardina pilchardus TaxID=27697 RepID=UPI002E0F5B96